MTDFRATYKSKKTYVQGQSNKKIPTFKGMYKNMSVTIGRKFLLD